MKFFNQFAAFGMAALLLASCAQETPWGVGNGRGGVKLRVEALGDVEAAVPAVRAITADIVTPPSDLFSVSMVKEGGGYSKTWTSINEFAKEESFPVGTYTLTASYGDDKSQGRVLTSDNGYEHAYYYGETEVKIVEGDTTQVRLTVGLMNAIVVVEYTDAFKNFFKDYKTIMSAGANTIDLGDHEAMSYVQPGDLNITISATQQNGQQITLTPAQFTIEPTHMYKLRYNIYGGEIGDTKLAIEFDDSLNEEPVVVNLSDALLNTRPPLVSTKGFEPGQQLATLSGTPYVGEAKFQVVADGGISRAVLTFTSDSYHPNYLTDNSVDLCDVSPENKALLEADGITAIGLFDAAKRGTMGELDLSGFFRKLPEGEHGVSFQVFDSYGQSNEPVGCSMSCIPVDMSATGGQAIFGERYADVLVSYNGPDPTVGSNNPFSFYVVGANGKESDECPILSMAQATRAWEAVDYIYRIQLPEIGLDSFDVNVKFNGASTDLVASYDFVYNDYQDNIVYDPMAKQVRFRTNFTDETKKRDYEDRLRVFVNGNEMSYTKDESINAYVIDGLDPATEYEVKTTVQVATPTLFGSTHTITTEAAAGVPNGDFSLTHETINASLLVGGPWRVTLFSSHSYNCPMLYNEPDNWASINAKTFHDTGEDNRNTWYMVASTFVESGNVTVRSVGYSHNGKPMDRTGGSAETTYHNTNTPSDDALIHAAGELFLGSYSYDGSNESRNYGYSFASRPKSFKFNYKYETVSEASGENGAMELELIASNGDVIASCSKDLTANSNMSEVQCDLLPNSSSYAFGKVPSQLRIRFVSSTSDNPGIHKPTGSELNDGHGLNNNDLGTNAAKALAVGNVLTVSNLRFEY